MTTQKFKLLPESVVKRLLDNGPKPVNSPHWTSYSRAIADWREYLHAELAMLEAAPQPPKLSDERILEICGFRPESKAEIGADIVRNRWLEIARAVEREIFGGGHE